MFCEVAVSILGQGRGVSGHGWVMDAKGAVVARVRIREWQLVIMFCFLALPI